MAGFFYDFGPIRTAFDGRCSAQVVLAPHNTLSDLDAVKEKYGHYGIPVTIDGRLHSKLVGIVTKRDVDFQEDRSARISASCCVFRGSGRVVSVGRGRGWFLFRV